MIPEGRPGGIGAGATFRAGMRVAHPEYGVGEIAEIEYRGRRPVAEVWFGPIARRLALEGGGLSVVPEDSPWFARLAASPPPASGAPMPKLTCRLIGHRLDPIALDYSRAVCERCGDEDPEDPPHVRAIGLLRWRLHLRRLAARDAARRWWRCPDCGRRFGRHDESRCFPF